jgi:translation initiation factor 1 (eIF-1/SUI1)
LFERISARVLLFIVGVYRKQKTAEIAETLKSQFSAATTVADSRQYLTAPALGLDRFNWSV